MSSQFKISVLMACLNPGGYLQAAIDSCLSQQGVEVELIIVDDGSTDGTTEWLMTLAAQNVNVHLINGPGTGPGAARNRALSIATGDWVAIMDADDLMHPQRLYKLVELANIAGADITADQLLAFTEGTDARTTWPFIKTSLSVQGTPVSLATLLTPTDGGFGSDLGYLKPVIRRGFLDASNVRYDEKVRIGEDFDFLARLIAEGAQLVVSGIAMYFYRRHSGSLSYRLNSTDADALIVANKRFSDVYAEKIASIKPLLAKRTKALSEYRGAVRLVEALKAKKIRDVAGIVFSVPASLLIFGRFALEGVKKRVKREDDGATQSPFPAGTVRVSPEILIQAKPDELDIETILQIILPLSQADAETKKRFQADLGGAFWAGYLF